MFSRLEEDTKKQIERSKNGTRFFADYYKDYIKEEYIDNKGRKRYKKRYIGDYYLLEKNQKKVLLIVLICLLLAFGLCFYAGIQYVEFNYIWYINIFQISFLFITVYLMFCNVQGFFLSGENTRKEFNGSIGNLIIYLPYTSIILGLIILLCIISLFIHKISEFNTIINIFYYLVALCLNYFAYYKTKRIKYTIKKGINNV